MRQKCIAIPAVWYYLVHDENINHEIARRIGGVGGEPIQPG
jgi:hypothetical protein